MDVTAENEKMKTGKDVVPDQEGEPQVSGAAQTQQ